MSSELTIAIVGGMIGGVLGVAGTLVTSYYGPSSNLPEDVELLANDNQIVIRSARKPRQGWANEFRTMAARGDDGLLDNDSLRRGIPLLPRQNKETKLNG